MSKIPVHDCPVMGANTEFVRTLNIKTDKKSWACIWCMIAEKITGEKPPTPPLPKTEVEPK